MKKIFFLLLIFSAFKGHAQYDSTKLRQGINAYGYDYKTLKSIYQLGIPTDTLPLAVRDSGSIAWLDGAIYSWNGWKWLSSITSISSGDTTVFAVTLDSTGQPQARLLFSNGNNHITSNSKILVDSANKKIGINVNNISQGGPGTKLVVGGNTLATGNATAAKHITSGGTSNDFVKGDGSLDGSSYQKTTDSINVSRLNGGKIDTSHLPHQNFLFNNPLYALNDSTAGLRTDSLPSLVYATYDSTAYTSKTLIPKQYLDDRISAVTASGITRTELQDTAAAIRSSIPAQFNPIAGTNVTLSGTYPNITFNASGGGSSTIDTTVTATSNGQTNFVFASLPTRYLVMINGVPFTNYTTSGGTTIIVGWSDIQIGDIIRLYQTQ